MYIFILANFKHQNISWGKKRNLTNRYKSPVNPIKPTRPEYNSRYTQICLLLPTESDTEFDLITL